MKRILYLTLLLASIANSASAQLRLSTVQPSVGAIVGVQNYVAILVEGVQPVSTLLELAEGPGQLTYDNTLHRWLWHWQPPISDTGKSFQVAVKGMQPGERTTFTVTPRPFAADRFVTGLKNGGFYSGISTPWRVKQPGLDGEYRLTLKLDDSIVAQVSEPVLAYRADLHATIGKQARFIVDYTAPLTGKTVTLIEYASKMKYPPLRIVPSLELEVGQPAFFMAALGMQPNYYTHSATKIFTVESHGYFEDTAQMIFSWLHTDDPFSLFSTDPLRTAEDRKLPSFEFGLRQTDKAKAITEKSGKIIPVTFYDPVTKQTASMEVRIYPRRAEHEE